MLTISAAGRADGRDAVLAEALFTEGKRLMNEGRLADACPKLAESQRLDPAGGTALLHALCLERAGQTASAWTAFQEALAFADRERNDERLAIAKKHADELAPKLTRLTVRVHPAPGLVVTRDGEVMPEAAWNVAAPIDPGEHVVTASAPGSTPFRAAIVASAPGEIGVDVPALAPIAKPIDPPPPIASRSRPPAIGVAALTTGGALLLGGAAFGVAVLVDEHDVHARCPASPCPDGVAQRENARARARADVATVLVGAGALASAAGVYLLVRTSGARVSASPRGLAFEAEF